MSQAIELLVESWAHANAVAAIVAHVSTQYPGRKIVTASQVSRNKHSRPAVASFGLERLAIQDAIDHAYAQYVREFAIVADPCSATGPRPETPEVVKTKPRRLKASKKI
jgi:hypothetical protein